MSRAVLPSNHLAAYLTGAAGAAVLLGAPQAEASVTAITFSFGTTFDTNTGGGPFTVNPGMGQFHGFGSDSFMGLGSINKNVGYVYHTGSYSPQEGTMQFFTPGTVIGTGLNGLAGSGTFYGYYYGGPSPFNVGSDQINKMIGFRTDAGNWGWADVTWIDSTKTLTINQAYAESVPGASISVGDVGSAPEPSRALLALAGLGGVALRRRRKTAA